MADSTDPNKLWWGVKVRGSIIVLDMGLEFKQTENGNYYRIHILPKRLSEEQKSKWYPWLQVRLDFDEERATSNTIFLYAKLPDNLDLNQSGKIITDWFICDACFKGRESEFSRLAHSKSVNKDDQWWYHFVQSPARKPNWSGDMEEREQQILAKEEEQAREKQRLLDQMEAKLPPQIRRDKYMVQLSSLLKQQNFQAALPLFTKLETLPIEQDPSIKFFYGEALLKTDSAKEALTKLYEYINEQGASATHYAKALDYINQAESSLLK